MAAHLEIPDPRQRVYELFGDHATGEDRLHVGCGSNHMPGWINMDSESSQNPEVIGDLNVRLPFDDESFDVIYAHHVLEHVEDILDTVFELHRILKPGGRLLVVVPHAWTDLGSANPFHRQRFTPHTFMYFRSGTFSVPGTSGFQAQEGKSIADWERIVVRMMVNEEWLARPDLAFAAQHYVNVVEEIQAIFIKKGS